MTNLLVINVDLRETRVALIEEGVIAELQIERAGARGTVGNIVLGKVTRVLPGMQAAFIDVGQDRAAFLHVEDLIRPDDFESYLAGAAREKKSDQELPQLVDVEDDEDDEADGEDVELEASADDESDEAEEEDADGDEGESEDEDAESDEGAESDEDEEEDADEDAEDEDAEDEDAEDEEEEDADGDEAEDADSEDDDADADEEDADEEDADEEDAESADDDADNDGEDEATEGGEDDDAPEPDETESEEDDEPETTVYVPKQSAASEGDEEQAAGTSTDGGKDPSVEEAGPETQLSASPEVDDEEATSSEDGEVSRRSGRRRRRRRGRRRRGKDQDEAPEEAAPPQPEPSRRSRSAKQGGRNKKGRSAKGSDRDRTKRSSNGAPGRVSRSVPITEVVREGDEVVVQISKEPIGTKGARVTSHVSLPGRYVVYLPTVDHVGISKRIGSARERSRLRKAIESVKPPHGGLIVRTVAEGLTKKNLKADVGYLLRVWAEVAKAHEQAKSPAVLYDELDLVLKAARDLFTDDIQKIVIDDRHEYARLVRFVEMFMPERVKDVELYQGDDPIFDAYGIEDEIGRALSRKVPLPSGGYLILDQAEALTAIDVNTGRYVGKGSKDLEETALKTNLEAVDEIAYQLRFRNIGGLVILDLIDMENRKNREKVLRALEAKLVKDKAKTTLNRISELGLIEMTRKRTRESLGRTMHEPCFYCDGTGQIMSRSTIAYEILRQIRRELRSLKGYAVHVNAHPAIVDLLKTEEREAIQEAERRFMRRIYFTPKREYHIEQFDLHGE